MRYGRLLWYVFLFTIAVLYIAAAAALCWWMFQARLPWYW